MSHESETSRGSGKSIKFSQKSWAPTLAVSFLANRVDSLPLRIFFFFHLLTVANNILKIFCEGLNQKMYVKMQYKLLTATQMSDIL